MDRRKRFARPLCHHLASSAEGADLSSDNEQLTRIQQHLLKVGGGPSR